MQIAQDTWVVTCTISLDKTCESGNRIFWETVNIRIKTDITKAEGILFLA
jgi:hypothetical protein